jgi:menaquinone-specific isochorismate synthase
MLDRLRLPETLLPRLREVAQTLPAVAGARLVSVTLALPGWGGRLPVPLAASAPLFYRAHRAAGQVLLGIGEALAVPSTGPSRLARIDAALARLRPAWQHLDLDGTGLEAGALAGFAFDPDDRMEGDWAGWPNTLLWVPRVLVQRRGEACGVTLTGTPGELAGGVEGLARWLAPASPVLDNLLGPPPGRGARGWVRRLEDGDEPSDWLALVGEGRDAVAGGRLRKVVPVRAPAVEIHPPPDPARIVAELEHRYPRCAVWALTRGAGTLVAASPERLVALHRGQVTSDALGGTAPAGDRAGTPSTIPGLGSPKVRREHDLVVEAVGAALAPVVEGLACAPTPEVVTLRQLAHLRTVFRGRARSGVSLLGLAARLHPTPAVCGLPQADALAWLRGRGNARRGWYTGAVGWVDRRGDGELSVVLRCGLLQGGQARLFAGAGVVAESEPEAELAETELKLAGFLEALRSA